MLTRILRRWKMALAACAVAWLLAESLGVGVVRPMDWHGTRMVARAGGATLWLGGGIWPVAEFYPEAEPGPILVFNL